MLAEHNIMDYSLIVGIAKLSNKTYGQESYGYSRSRKSPRCKKKLKKNSEGDTDSTLSGLYNSKSTTPIIPRTAQTQSTTLSRTRTLVLERRQSQSQSQSETLEGPEDMTVIDLEESNTENTVETSSESEDGPEVLASESESGSEGDFSLSLAPIPYSREITTVDIREAKTFTSNPNTKPNQNRARSYSSPLPSKNINTQDTMSSGSSSGDEAFGVREETKEHIFFFPDR